MMNIKTISEKVNDQVRAEIEKAVDFEENRIVTDVDFGCALVHVEIRLVSKSGWLEEEVELYICHKEYFHESPLLEEALKNALPTWENVETERVNIY